MPSKRGYKPVDRQSEALVRKNRLVKTVLVVVAVAIVVLGVHLRILKTNVKDLDDFFSGILMDDKGYYFPTTANDQPATRSLEDVAPNDDDDASLWGYEWKDDVDASAAVGAYYTAKGIALANYYKAKNVPPNSWTYDWQEDSKHGIEIAERYKAIGEAIDEHYKALYHPNYSKKSMKGSMKGWTLHDWKSDRERGLAIAKNFKDLGDKISKHYIKFKPSEAAVLTDAQWMEYKEMGEALAKYYHDKGVAVAKFYKGKYDPMYQVDESTVKASVNQTDPIAIKEAMKEKGLAIATYYRARYDPTFRPEEKNYRVPPANATGEEWAPWGVDPAQDKAHGKAIGKYFRKQGGIGQYYYTRGKELGSFYADYYRSVFDPTYTAPADLN